MKRVRRKEGWLDRENKLSSTVENALSSDETTLLVKKSKKKERIKLARCSSTCLCHQISNDCIAAGATLVREINADRYFLTLQCKGKKVEEEGRERERDVGMLNRRRRRSNKKVNPNKRWRESDGRLSREWEKRAKRKKGEEKASMITESTKACDTRRIMRWRRNEQAACCSARNKGTIWSDFGHAKRLAMNMCINWLSLILSL